jgi:hypothetical protein
MKTARPAQSETGVVKQPGSWVHGSASDAPCTSIRHLHAAIDKNTATLYGGRVGELLLQLGLPRMYDRTTKAWTVSVNRLDDVLAFAEYRQHRIVTVGVLR